MKKVMVLTLSFLLIFSMLAVFPAMAKKGDVEFKANGKLTHRSIDLEPDPSSELLRGVWEVKIKDGKVDFKYWYHELNKDESSEYSPEGTIDHFRGYLEDGTFVAGEGYYEIYGTRHVDKKMWLLEDYPEEPPDWYPGPDHARICWIKDFFVTTVRIRITPNEALIDNWNDGSIDIYGVILNYHSRS